MDLKAKKESLLQQHQDLTKQINRNIDLRSRVLGALELIEQIEGEKKKKMGTCKKCEHGCHCSDSGACKNCECKDCNCKKEKQEFTTNYDEDDYCESCGA